MGVNQKIVFFTPQIIHFDRVFHYKPSSLGVFPLFLETPIWQFSVCMFNVKGAIPFFEALFRGDFVGKGGGPLRFPFDVHIFDSGNIPSLLGGSSHLVIRITPIYKPFTVGHLEGGPTTRSLEDLGSPWLPMVINHLQSMVVSGSPKRW